MTDKRFKLPIPIKEMTPEQYREYRNSRAKERRAGTKRPKLTKEQLTQNRRDAQRKKYEQERIAQGKTYREVPKVKRSKEEINAYYREYRRKRKPSTESRPRLKLSYEEKAERRREQNRKYWRSKNPVKVKSKMTEEQKLKRNQEYYIKKRLALGLPYILQEQRSELAIQKKQAAENKRIMKETIKAQRPAKRIKVVLTHEEKLAKWKAANDRRAEKKAKNKPKVKPVRKAKPKLEPKPKPEILPTLVRDESDYVSVRIDSKTVIRVPPGKDIEQVKQRFIAKMLHNSRI